MNDRLQVLAGQVAEALEQEPGWNGDALEVRDTFDAFVDAALQRCDDEATLTKWLS